MLFEILVLIFTVLILAFAYFLSENKPNHFPPGPLGLPVVGHMLFLGKEPHKTAIKWKSKYGPIVGIKFGSFWTVIINDFKLIKEAFNENTFSGRPDVPTIKDRSGGRPEGIIFSSGKTWQEQRRFTLRHLRDFGFGTKSMESIVHIEIQELIERFKETAGIPINTMNQFNIAVVNALWTIISGERFSHDDTKLNDIIKLIASHLFESSKLLPTIAKFIPWIAKYFPSLTGYQTRIHFFDSSRAFIKPFIDAHMQTHEVDNPRDFIDVYVDEMKRTVDPSSSFYKDRNFSLQATIVDLFLAGVETTSTTLTWIFLYMARNQHVQEKMVAEINQVVGNSRLPSLSDRAQMPYTEAVIHEVMRKSTLIAFGVLHGTTEDVEFHGYNIPKGTMVLPNIYEAHNNIEIWGDPENFRPERFLSKDGSKFERREGFCSFSIGKRQCLGETLARDELFLFTAALFQVFHIDYDHSCTPPTLVPDFASISVTRPHKLIFTIRE